MNTTSTDSLSYVHSPLIGDREEIGLIRALTRSSGGFTEQVFKKVIESAGRAMSDALLYEMAIDGELNISVREDGEVMFEANRTEEMAFDAAENAEFRPRVDSMKGENSYEVIKLEFRNGPKVPE